jgi:hypothetical protein
VIEKMRKIFYSSEVLSLYAQRWGIEMLFKAEKTNGFYLEETHIIAHDRLATMLSMLYIAVAISVKIGVIRHSIKPIKVKKHGRRAISIFKYGFDTLKK